MEVEAEWAEAWASWAVQVDQAVASLVGDPRLAPQATPDPITSWALEECLASEAVVEAAAGEEEEEADSPLAAPPSSTCHQTSAPPCTLGQDSTPCCPRGAWGVLEVEGRLTLGSACHPSSSTDRAGTRSTARRYLVAEAQEDPRMAPCPPWEEEAWVLA